MKSYSYKGFVFTRGTCEIHPLWYEVRDFRDYNENTGSAPTGICATSIKQAKEKINELIFVRENIPF